MLKRKTKYEILSLKEIIKMFSDDQFLISSCNRKQIEKNEDDIFGHTIILTRMCIFLRKHHQELSIKECPLFKNIKLKLVICLEELDTTQDHKKSKNWEGVLNSFCI